MGFFKDSDRNNGVGYIFFINLNFVFFGRFCWVGIVKLVYDVCDI